MAIAAQRDTLEAKGLIRLAEKHRKTPMISRTLMQHALPTTFGLKLANEAAAFAISSG